MNNNLQTPDKKPRQTDSSREDDGRANAYERMQERTRQFLDDTTQDLLPNLIDALDSAKQQAIHLGELSKDEAELISTYLQRDLRDAGEYIKQQRGELADWLNFDIELIEERIWESLSLLVDQTTVELNQLKARAEYFGEWHTGEITGPGTLLCSACGEKIHFHKTGHIPPCPKCHATIYKRPGSL
ncbi:MAG: zinc ribbon-containing protein [Gammaproteobacteria bacterium]|nr:zinc ribbon-containing protein [Gammaproteobacteria bacterium]